MAESKAPVDLDNSEKLPNRERAVEGAKSSGWQLQMGGT